ncbi:MAG: YadA C-terminal domain-containing protein, partial [Haemophilus parainfluenzae]
IKTLQTHEGAIKTHEGAIQTHEKIIQTHENEINAQKVVLNTHENAINAHKAVLDRHETAIRENRANVAGLNTRIDSLGREIKNGLSTQAALNGLFQPYNVGKLNISAAVGGYRNKTALAVGSGFRFNEKFAMKAGVAVNANGGGGMAYNVGANFEF